MGHFTLWGHIRSSTARSVLLEVGSLNLFSIEFIWELRSSLSWYPIEELLDVSQLWRLFWWWLLPSCARHVLAVIVWHIILAVVLDSRLRGVPVIVIGDSSSTCGLSNWSAISSRGGSVSASHTDEWVAPWPVGWSPSDVTSVSGEIIIPVSVLSWFLELVVLKLTRKPCQRLSSVNRILSSIKRWSHHLWGSHVLHLMSWN